MFLRGAFEECRAPTRDDVRLKQSQIVVDGRLGSAYVWVSQFVERCGQRDLDRFIEFYRALGAPG